MSENNKDNFKYSLSYVPLVAFVLLFIEKDITKEFRKHINYWMILFWVYFVVTFIFKALFLYILLPIVFLAYIVVSVILWYKVYSWEETQVDALDNIEDKLKDIMWK